MHSEILNTYEILQYLRNFEKYLFFEYQPLVCLETGEIAGFETLARMRGDDGRIIEPLEFVPLAVEHGFITDIGYFTLRAACGYVTAATAAGLDIGYVTVNISAAQLYDAHFIEKLSALLDETGIDPRKLVFEFTEDVVIRYAESYEMINRLPELGIGVAIDDFGTGYSGLSYFDKLPIQLVKIERSFSQGLSAKKTEALTRAVLRLIESFHMQSCAEGIETEEQLKFFREAKCSLGQGFLFGAAMSEAHLLSNFDALRATIREKVVQWFKVH